MGITTVFVTHDQDEALEIADQIVIMNNGRIEQAGTPGEIYGQPANSFVEEFLDMTASYPTAKAPAGPVAAWNEPVPQSLVIE